MPDPVTGVTAAVTIGSTVLGNRAQKDAASTAADAQTASSTRAIAETRRQFDETKRLMAPFVDAGSGAIDMMGILSGQGTPEEQAAAYKAIEDSPAFAANVRQSEEGILSNAAATGGVRGGNVQTSLATNRTFQLQDLIDRQYAKLGGLATIGVNAASGQANLGASAATNIANLEGDIGAARAGESLARGQSNVNTIEGIGKGIGIIAGGF